MMIMIAIKRYHSDDFNAWNEFVENSKNATFLFNRNYLDYHADRFKDHSLVVFEDNKMAALLPANERGNSIVSHGGLSYGGLILNRNITLREVLNYFYHILKHYHGAGFEGILYKCLPSYLAQSISQEDLYVMHLLGAQLVRRDTSCVLPLQNSLPYQERRKRAIKKASKAGIQVREHTDPTFFWDNILAPNLQERYKIKPVHSLPEIKLLMSRFPERIRLFEAVKDTPLAGTIIYETPTVAHAQYISATAEGKDTGALDLLFDHLIKNVYPAKQYFSFGISNEQDGKYLNQGLQDWKEGFGARTYIIDFYVARTEQYTKLPTYD